MASKKQRKIKWEIVGLNSLVLLFVMLLLSYTFVHTGAVLARHINPPALGYIAAFGIEGLIAVLSWRRAFKAGAGQAVNITLAIVLVISAVANLYEGYAVKYGSELTVAGLGNLDYIQVVVGVLVTAVIPFLVFMAGEVMGQGLEELGKFISHSVSLPVEPVSLPSEPVEPVVSLPVEVVAPIYDTPIEAVTLPDDTITPRQERVLQMISDKMTQSAIAKEIGVSRITIARDIAALNGKVKVTQ
jgi:DNA-binding CsgD family transcriptional regulator